MIPIVEKIHSLQSYCEHTHTHTTTLRFTAQQMSIPVRSFVDDARCAVQCGAVRCGDCCLNDDKGLKTLPTFRK